MKERKFLTAKNIIIGLIALVLIAASIAGVTVYLNDSGESTAATKQADVDKLPTTGNNGENTDPAGVDGDTENGDSTIPTVPGQNNNQTTGTQGGTTQVGASTPTTEEIIDSIEGTVVEQERKLYEDLKLSWTTISIPTIKASMGIYKPELQIEKTATGIIKAEKPQETIDITNNTDIPMVRPGDSIIYTIRVANTGNYKATNVVITDSLDVIFDGKKIEAGKPLAELETLEFGKVAILKTAYEVEEKDIATAINNGNYLTNKVTINYKGKDITTEENIEVETKYSYKVEHYIQNSNGKFELAQNDNTDVVENVEYGTPVSYEKNTYKGYKFDSTLTKNGTAAVPANNNLVVELYYVKDAEQTKTLSYTVEYYQDGELFETLDPVTKEVWVNDADTIKVGTVDISDDRYIGYNLDTETTGTIPTEVKSGTTIKVYYEKDEDDTKILSYTVEYYQDGELFETLDPVTKEVWVKDADTMEVGTVDISDDRYVGYNLDTDETGTIPTEVESGTTIKVYYEKDENDTKTLSYTVEYYQDGELFETLDPVTKEVWVKDADTMEVGTVDISDDRYIGYNLDTDETGTIPTEVESGTTIKVYYEKDENDTKTLSYTVEYYQDGELFETLEPVTKEVWINDDDNITVGTIDTSNDRYEGYKFERTNPSTIPSKIATGSTIKVYYIKPAKITVSKYNDLAENAKVEYDDEITYTIKAVNEGSEAGEVTIKDEDLKNAIGAGEIELVGSTISISNGDTTTVEDLASGIKIEVPAKTANGNGEVTITFTVKVKANVKTTISNKVTVTGGENSETDNVQNRVEKTATVKTDTQTIKGTNIVLVIDTSTSMDDKSDNEDGWLIKRCDDSDCTRTHSTRWFPIIGTYNAHTKLTTAIDAACRFIDQIYPDANTNNGTTITVLEFNDSTSQVGSMATSYEGAQSLKTAIKALDVAGNSTNMGNALTTTDTILGNIASPYDQNDNVVVFLSDGDPTDGDAYKQAAANLKSATGKSATIYTIGFEITNSGAAVLSEIASSDKAYTSDMENLFDTFDDISLSIKEDTDDIQSTDGRIELVNLKVPDANHPITIRITGKTEPIVINSLPDSKIIVENGKYYLDLTQFKPEDKVSIEYFQGN